MNYFQSILSLYESTVEEKKEIIVKQLVSFADTNKQNEHFFQFLYDKMENINLLTPVTMQSILNISIDFLNSQSSQLSIQNVKLYVQYLLKLFSLKIQPSSYPKYNNFLKTSFLIVKQYNQESLFSSISKIPHEQSIIPLSILFTLNQSFFDSVLNIMLSSFPNFQKDKQLSIWAIAMTNIFLNKNTNDDSNSVIKSILKLLDGTFKDTFLSLSPKFELFAASLHYLPQSQGDELLSSHCLNLLCSVSISSSLDEITLAVNFAKTVLIRLKNTPIPNLTTNQLVDSIFTYILPGYRSNELFNASLTDFFNEADQEYLQSKITAECHSENTSLSTLFLISRYPTHETIPCLLTRARVDQRSQYLLIFHFLSHNLVPFRFLPRLFSILEPEDLHFLNEIFEQKPFLYCSAAIKYLSQCKRVEKIEFLSTLFSSAKSLPIVNSPYAQTAYIVVACLRAYSKVPGCPIRLLLDYLISCMNSSKENPQEKQSIEKSSTEKDEENVADEDKEKSADVVDEDKEKSTDVVGSSISANPSSYSPLEILDLTNDDIESITKAAKEGSSDVSFYDVVKALEELNKSSFCQSQAIYKIGVSDPERRDSLINESLELLKKGDLIYAIIIGSLSNDPILIHNCVLTLAQSDVFLLTFFFTTAASCNPELILKEIRDYIVKEPEAAPQSFVSRLFSSSTISLNRRQRIARRCIIGMSPFVPFSNDLYETLLASFPSDPDSISAASSAFNEKTGISASSSSFSSSSSSSLVCECVTAVCTKMAMKEDLHLILQKLIEKSDSFNANALTTALISVLNANKSLTDKDALSVIKLWIKLLLSNKLVVDSNKNESAAFESVLLMNKNTSNLYLKEIESSIRINGDVPSLFSSLNRALPFLTNFNLAKQHSFLTIIISNTLSMNDSVQEICVNLLRSAFQLKSIIKPLKGVVFSNEYIEAVRPFFVELSVKFEKKQLIQLVEALLSYYEEKQPQHQESVFLFTIFAILRQPQIFIDNKFVSKIASACEKMTRKNDYAIIFYLFKAYDAMSSADRTKFFNEFIIAPENEFISMYFEKYSCYYDVLQPLLIPRIFELKSIDSKWKEFLEFERLLKLLNGFVRLFIRDTTSSETISKIIFTFLISLSSVNFIRKRGFSVDSYLTVFEETLLEFKNLTGISLINGKLNMKNDNDFYELISYFAQSFQYLQLNVVQFLINSIESLISTNHIECGILCLSSYLVSVSRSSSEDVKRLKNKSVDLFTSFLKNCKFESSLISFVISRLPSAFSVATLKQMDQNYLTIFLKINFETATKASDCLPSLQLILNVIRSSTPSFIGNYANQIIQTLKTVVGSGKINLSSILVLNIIGELGRRKQEPTYLLKDASVSFRSLAPLLLSDDEEILTRVKAIFSLMIFGKAESEPDFELIFSSLMSIFVGYENDSTNYVSIASDLLKTAEKMNVLNMKKLELLKFVFQPVLSVGDSVCNVAICDLLKYLKKFTSTVSDDELFTYALSMMTLFAKPKRS